MNSPTRLYTIGHSNRPLDAFLPLLRECAILTLVDIRRFPSSRKFPHFNRENLAASLQGDGIAYQWFEALGGRCHGQASAESPNAGLLSPAFRNYADYMLTESFRCAIAALEDAARQGAAAIMCAEKLFWRCHRRILSDYLVLHGVEVMHIIDPGRMQTHKLSAEARVTADGRIIYPPVLWVQKEQNP